MDKTLTLEQKLKKLKEFGQTNTDKYLAYLDEHIGNENLCIRRQKNGN